MARRIRGAYSPRPRDGGAPGSDSEPLRPEVAARAPAGQVKANLAFALALPFLIRGFSGTPATLLTGFGAAALLLLAAWLTRAGVQAQAAYEARSLARPPALPRKLLGAVLTGAGLALGTLLWRDPGLLAPCFGLLGAALHLGAFGLDPWRAKGLQGQDRFQTERVARALGEAETLLAAMQEAILRARDPGLEARVQRFAQTARSLFARVEEDPGDLTAARRYLSVYLQGARDATVKFADLYARQPAPQARADYETLLQDLETTFARRSQSLGEASHSDLDIEIQVLRERLKLET